MEEKGGEERERGKYEISLGSNDSNFPRSQGRSQGQSQGLGADIMKIKKKKWGKKIKNTCSDVGGSAQVLGPLNVD